jgi:transposase
VDLTEKQWAKLASLLPEEKRRDDGKGRPPADKRQVINGILWVLRTGAPWKDLPERYPSRSTCHRWLPLVFSSGLSAVPSGADVDRLGLPVRGVLSLSLAAAPR